MVPFQGLWSLAPTSKKTPKCPLWAKARGPLGGAASSPCPLRVAFSRLQTFLYCLMVAQTWRDLYYFLNTLKLAL